MSDSTNTFEHMTTNELALEVTEICATIAYGKLSYEAKEHYTMRKHWLTVEFMRRQKLPEV